MARNRTLPNYPTTQLSNYPIHERSDKAVHERSDKAIDERSDKKGGRLSFDGLPWCTGRVWGRLCVSPQGADRTKLTDVGASTVPRAPVQIGQTKRFS